MVSEARAKARYYKREDKKMKISVTKQSGKREPYYAQKVLDSIVRSKVEPDKAQEILAKVETKLFDGIRTEELYRLVYREIVEEGLKEASTFYQLREAIAQMDSIDFEHFIGETLASQGYETIWNQIVAGECVSHQGDVLAKDKDGRVFWVEVKHHFEYHRDTDLGTIVEMWGRLADLKAGLQQGNHEYGFVNAWLITNTKFSAHALQYAACKKLRVTGWKNALNDMGQEDNGRCLDRIVAGLGFEKVKGFVEKAIGIADRE